MFEDVLILKKGGIHIKKKNRGSFTRWCKGRVTEECIRRGKNSSNPAIRKKATFAANARKWKHENGGILKYQNPATTLDLPEGSVYGGELEPVIIKPAPIKAELNTYYPIVSKYPRTGHSELILHHAGPQKSSVVITRGGYNSDYNLITNNCSDSTRCAVEQIYNEKINPILFTTPGDVRDFLLKKGVDKIKIGKGVESQYFEIPFATAMELRNKNIDYQIQDYLKKAEDHKKDMEKLAKSHDRKWNSSGFDESITKVVQEFEKRKYKFQPFKNKNGGILKAQEGTGNLYTPHPLSPVGIALNQAKAMAKMKGEQPHLPTGVKEVVGPDGKKVAIRTEQPLVPLEQSIAEWLPGTGDVAEVGQIANDVKNSNLGSAILGAGLLLLPGTAGKLLKTNVGKKISNFLNKDLFNYDALKIKLQNPHLKKYYHGSPYDFDIENFHKGTTNDMGLHASDRLKVAEYFTEGKGPIYEFFAPKPSAEVIDWHTNDISMFVGNKKFNGGLNIYDGTESSKLLFNSLKKYGGNDVIEFIPKTDPRVASLFDIKLYKPFTLKQDVTLNGSLVHPLDIPSSEYDKLRQLYADYPKSIDDDGTIRIFPSWTEGAAKRANINSEASDILSKNGYSVFKYENTIPNEGGGTSYMILDPSKIKLVDPKKTVKMKHALIGLGTGLGAGYGISQLKDE